MLFKMLKKTINRQSKNGPPLFLGLISGCSVFYFLYFFSAYGIQKELSYSGHSHIFRSFSYGFMTFAYLAVSEKWIKPKLNLNTLRSRMIWYISMIILGSQLIFILFNFFWNWQEWNIEAYLLIQKEFPLIMVLPVSLYLVMVNNVKPKFDEDIYFLFRSENGKDQLKIKLQNFLYANVSRNYINIVYSSNNKAQQHLIRKPLKVLEAELVGYPQIVRSHRGYLVNKRNIQTIKQNKKNIQIEIGEVNIPVSIQFRENFIH